MADTFSQNISDNCGIKMADLKYQAGEAKEEREWCCINIKNLANALGHQTAMLGNLYRREGDYEDALLLIRADMVESLYREENTDRRSFMITTRYTVTLLTVL